MYCLHSNASSLLEFRKLALVLIGIALNAPRCIPFNNALHDPLFPFLFQFISNLCIVFPFYLIYIAQRYTFFTLLLGYIVKNNFSIKYLLNFVFCINYIIEKFCKLPGTALVSLRVLQVEQLKTVFPSNFCLEDFYYKREKHLLFYSRRNRNSSPILCASNFSR